jgi:hypothetical protein
MGHHPGSFVLELFKMVGTEPDPPEVKSWRFDALFPMEGRPPRRPLSKLMSKQKTLGPSSVLDLAKEQRIL